MTVTPTVQLHHETTGPADGPVLVMGPSLGTDLHLFDPQVAVLARDRRTVRFDLRGHGRSPAAPGPYVMDDLAADVIGLLDELAIDQFDYVGVSIGGAIGLCLALHYPARLRRLVVCASAARFADPDSWPVRAAQVRAEGTGFLRPSRRGIWYTPAFAEREPLVAARLLGMLDETTPEGYAGCCEAIATYDVRSRLPAITAPTRVIAGADDPATPPAMCGEIAAGIPGADLVVIDGASHLVNVEKADDVSAAITEHLGPPEVEPGS